MPPARRSNPVFAERLRSLRAGHGWTQQQVVDLLPEHDGERITKQAYSEYERGVSAPSRRNTAALERLYGEEEHALSGLLGADEGDRLSSLEEAIRSQGELLRLIAARLDQAGL